MLELVPPFYLSLLHIQFKQCVTAKSLWNTWLGKWLFKTILGDKKEKTLTCRQGAPNSRKIVFQDDKEISQVFHLPCCPKVHFCGETFFRLFLGNKLYYRGIFFSQRHLLYSLHLANLLHVTNWDCSPGQDKDKDKDKNGSWVNNTKGWSFRAAASLGSWPTTLCGASWFLRRGSRTCSSSGRTGSTMLCYVSLFLGWWDVHIWGQQGQLD